MVHGAVVLVCRALISEHDVCHFIMQQQQQQEEHSRSHLIIPADQHSAASSQQSQCYGQFIEQFSWSRDLTAELLLTAPPHTAIREMKVRAEDKGV